MSCAPVLFDAASTWLLVQVATQVFPFFHIAEWVVRWIIVAAAIGFPFRVLFSWFYQWTPQGAPARDRTRVGCHPEARRISPETWIFWIMAMLAVAVVLLLTDKFVLRERSKARAHPKNPSHRRRRSHQKSIAVLPFENLSEEKGDAYFADGILRGDPDAAGQDRRSKSHFAHFDAAVSKQTG